jgi:FMN-dependent oxidoreductase (nitrilotriacetate monooxygenase family)
MAKEIRMNAFVMNCMGHQSPGLWTHPRDLTRNYCDLDYWTTLARTLERGKFDAVFFADVQGIYDVFTGGPGPALRHGVQVPNADPFVLISAMAFVTTHLGFAVTGNLSSEPPYLFARRLTTLDHLTKGRIGWNIVTGFLKSAAKGLGAATPRKHDVRYDIAEEYMEIMYKLWEGSWDDGAVVADRTTGLLIDPDKVRRIEHDGEYFSLDAIHLSEPSPQRTPVLFQAGTSVRGRAFSAKHAEGIFIAAPTKEEVGKWVADIRRQTADAGRDPKEILVFSEISAIVGKTEAEAKGKHRDYLKYANYEAALALVSGWIGVDLSKIQPEDYVEAALHDTGAHSHLESITNTDPAKKWTVREVAEYIAIGGIAPVVVGSPEQVVDEMQSWVQEADVDGFNLAYAVYPEGYTDFVELVIPEMQRRGIYKVDYRPGTLREKLYGAGRWRLPDVHPVADFRFKTSGRPAAPDERRQRA